MEFCFCFSTPLPLKCKPALFFFIFPLFQRELRCTEPGPVWVWVQLREIQGNSGRSSDSDRQIKDLFWTESGCICQVQMYFVVFFVYFRWGKLLQFKSTRTDRKTETREDCICSSKVIFQVLHCTNTLLSGLDMWLGKSKTCWFTHVTGEKTRVGINQTRRTMYRLHCPTSAIDPPRGRSLNLRRSAGLLLPSR